MKKIGIVSCYFQHNYGSMLQAFATQMALDKLYIENETINISGFYDEIRKVKIKYFIKASLTSDFLFSKSGMVKNIVIKKCSKSDYVSKSKIRSQKFDAFSRKMFRLSKSYASKEELSQKCEENYSAVIVGSDQLWLPGNIVADYYTLNFVPKSVNSISYATSFGQLTLPKDCSAKARVFLKKIRHIGVREESGKDLVQELVGRNVPVVCDPTLLFTGEEWMQIQKVEPLVKERYIFCYYLGNNKIHREFAKRLKTVTGYKIVALIHLDEYVKYDNIYADETPYDIDPADFLNLIRNATYVCTDSFHCSVFSILYQKEFFTFKRFTKKTKQSTNSRLDTLFKISGLNDRMKNGDEEIKECIGHTINYKIVHKKIDKIRNKSFQYLEDALLDKESTDID